MSHADKGFSLIAAVHFPTMGIGHNGELPWKISQDLQHFAKLTTDCSPNSVNAVIMGSKTWQSIPSKYRPLKGRKNVVLSRCADANKLYEIPDEVIVATSLQAALEALSVLDAPRVENIFLIGGEELYREGIQSTQCKKIYITEVHGDLNSFDAHFPVIPAHLFTMVRRSEIFHSDKLSCRFVEYSRCPSIAFGSEVSLGMQCLSQYDSNAEEGQYLMLIRDIMETGVARGDRTGTGTISKFGVQMRFSLRDNRLPLITTKKVFWRGVAEELLWFVKGSTNANELSSKGIHIWDGNGSRAFLDSRGLHHREEGDLGPVYGFQWRHFGAQYTDFNANYCGQGVDQLKACIDTIKTNPTDRRIVMTAWNPADLNLMALPPCHMFCQFYVANDELSCQMYQRSADMGLGVPFNIASYALLTHMVAHVCGLKAGEFVHTIGDAHIYSDHVNALKEQVSRSPRPFPKLHFKKQVADIDSFVYEDFSVQDYIPHPPISMKMAV